MDQSNKAAKQIGFLVLLSGASTLGLLLGEILSDPLVFELLVGVFGVSAVVVGYSVARDWNRESGSSLGNPAFALSIVVFVGLHVPNLISLLSSHGIQILTEIRADFYPRFRQFGFPFVAAYLVEQLLSSHVESPTPSDRLHAFCAGFGFALLVFVLAHEWPPAGRAVSVVVVLVYVGLLKRGDIGIGNEGE